MRKYFYNESEKRLKTGWRILIFILIFWVFSSIIFLVKPLMGDITKREFLENYSIIIVFLLMLSASIAVPLARRLLDKRSLVSLGLSFNIAAFKDLIFGFAISGLMAGLFFFIVLIFDLIEFNGFNLGSASSHVDQPFNYVTFISVFSLASLFVLLLEHIFVGYWEELVFRGYLFQNMIDGMGLKVAIIISCLIYGLLHAMNPNAGLLSSVIIILFGFLRIYGYLLTKTLFLSIGMHIGWNFFQGPIFGFAASGHQMASFINQTPAGKSWLSGGEFGPEGSIIIIPIVVLALLAMQWWNKKQHA